MRKNLKVWIAILLMGLLTFSSGYFLCQAADDESMTNARFASILVDVLGIEMPVDANTLPDAELFNIQTNGLAKRGLTLFADAKPNTLVTRSDLANVLYDALIIPNTLTVEEKIAYLVNLGYTKDGNASDVLSSNEIITALNIPELAKAVAEAYSSPSGAALGVAGAEIPPAPANPESENPVSPI